MSPDVSRRALLGAGGLAVLSTVAGCSFGTEPSGSGPGGGGTTTRNTGRTYSFEVKNELTGDELRAAEGIEDSPPATVHIEAAHPVQAGEDEVIFERDLELPPGGERTIANAFTTEPGKTYTVDVELEPFVADPRSMRNYRDGTRWQPNGYGGPSSDTFRVTVESRDVQGDFRPAISVYA